MRLLALVVACALASACAQQRTLTLEAAPEDLFDESAPVGVSGSHSVAQRHGHIVGGTAEGIGTGMAQGALGSIAAGAESGGLVLGVVLAPVFAVGGGLYGAAAARPEEETGSAIAAIEKLYADDSTLNALAALIEERLAEMSFSTCRESRPPEDLETRAPSSQLPPDEPACEEPVNRMTLDSTYGFETSGAYSPRLRVSIDVSAVAANADRNRGALDFRWEYLSPELDFFSETASEAASLRQHLARAQRELADAIVNDLFLTRREVELTVTHTPYGERLEVEAGGVPPGTVRRIPSEEQLRRVR